MNIDYAMDTWEVVIKILMILKFSHSAQVPQSNKVIGLLSE